MVWEISIELGQHPQRGVEGVKSHVDEIIFGILSLVVDEHCVVKINYYSHIRPLLLSRMRDYAYRPGIRTSSHQNLASVPTSNGLISPLGRPQRTQKPSYEK